MEVVNSRDFCYNGYGTYTLNRTEISSDTDRYYNVSYSYKDSLIELIRPVYRLNRVNEINHEYANTGRYGDTLFTALMRVDDIGQSEIILQCQRTGKVGREFNMGWSDSVMIGPEHRVILNGDCENEYREPDKLILEFAFSKNPVELVNPHDSIWNRIMVDGKLIKAKPALEFFGGGGYYMGLPDAYDSTKIPGLQCNLYDSGKDRVFTTFRIPIPEYMRNMLTGGYFRCRLRVDAKKHGNELLNDDNDDFFVQNFYLYLNNEASEEAFIDYMQLLQPYSVLTDDCNWINIPAISIATNINLQFRYVQNYFMTLKEENQKSLEELEYGSANSYDRYWFFGSNYPYSDKYIEAIFNKINIYTRPLYPFEQLYKYVHDNELFCYSHDYFRFNDDYIQDNNSIIEKIKFQFGDVFAFDKPIPQNDVETENQKEIFGISLCGFNGGENSDDKSYGSTDGNCNGQVACRFTNISTIIYGFQAYFPDTKKSPQKIRFSVYKNGSNDLPGDLINESVMIRETNYDELAKENRKGGYITYLYGSEADTNQLPFEPKSSGFWVAIAQLDDEPLNLGASGHRMGMLTTNYDELTNGQNSTCIMIDNNWKAFDAVRDSQLVQTNNFAYENGLGSGNWKSFTPTTGNPAYSYLDNSGEINGYKTFSRGSFVPMIRLYTNGDHYTWKPNHVSDDFKSEGIIIFPNPANEYIEINLERCPTSAIYGITDKIAIYNVLGERVKSIPRPQTLSPNPHLSVDISDLPAGVYFVIIFNENSTKKVMFVKE